MIPLLDLKAQYRSLQAEMDAAVCAVMAEGHFILGPNVSALEQEIAAYLGVRHAVGVASGTDALIIGLRAAGVGAGDEVIVPAYTFFATAGAVLTVGAVPVIVDVDPRTYALDTAQVEARLTPRTRAIVPVHLYGHPAPMEAVLALARKHHLRVVEDNAQAFGARYHGQRTASLGDVGCLSFFPTKNLGGYGDGGMVVTDDDGIAEQARMLRVHGWKRKYYPEMLGYNSRLDEIQAAVLRVKLKYVDGWNEQRRALAEVYRAGFAGSPVSVPVEEPGCEHVYHLYVVRVPRRAAVQAHLKAAGIASDVYYPLPLHLTQPCRKLGGAEGDFPQAEQASRETLAIPLYPEMSSADQQQVIREVLAAVGG